MQTIAKTNSRRSSISTGALALVLALSSACVPQAKGPGGGGTGAGLQAGTQVPPTTSVEVSLDGGVKTREGGMRIAHRGAGAFSITATATLTRELRAGEQIHAVLIQGERVVRQGQLPVQGLRASSKVDVPDPGTYRLEVWSGKTMVASNTFVAAVLPLLDGQRELVLHQDVAPRLEFVPVNSVVWSHWDSAETDEAFIAEWWFNGKQRRVVAAQRSTFQRDMLKLVSSATTPTEFRDRPVWRFVTERFTVPDEISRMPGQWELRIFRDNRAPMSLAFSVSQGGVASSSVSRRNAKSRIELDVTRPENAPDRTKELAKLPRTPPRDSATGLVVTGAEIRALTRSEMLRTQRAQLNASFDTELVPQMRQLIGQAGKPWTEEERPN